jgi:hypothetical protein
VTVLSRDGHHLALVSISEVVILLEAEFVLEEGSSREDF